MNKHRICAVFLALFCFHGANAQDQAIGAMVGEVTGVVEDENGNMVAPKAELDVTVDITSAGQDLTAEVNGVFSCTEGLGMQVTFYAIYGHQEKTLTGFYSDVPGARELTKPILFEHVGGLNWRALVSGEAPSPTGPRAYDLQVDITLPRKAIFPGDQYPGTLSYFGDLNTTATVDVPLSIPLIGLNETLSIPIQLDGRWTARVIPLDDGGIDLSGSVSGSIQGLEPISLELTIPMLVDGELEMVEETLNFVVEGTFGGSLFADNPQLLTFAGSWAASTGDDGFGGDMRIDMPVPNIKQLTEVPFSFDGSFSFDPEIEGAGSFVIPFEVSGFFPFSINVPEQPDSGS